MIRFIQSFISLIGGALCYLFGPWDSVMITLVCVVIIDYVTGIISAGLRGELSSKKGFTGILKKIFIFLIIALSGMLDRVFPLANQAIRTTVCIFYIANESLSILENAGQIGLPLPLKLKETIEKLKDKEQA